MKEIFIRDSVASGDPTRHEWKTRKPAVSFLLSEYIINMTQKVPLKEGYAFSKCCSPSPSDKIVGYYSHDNYLKVHRHDCASLKEIDQARLVPLSWDEIVEKKGFVPENDYYDLDSVDFAVLRHHLEYGIDYSLMVAKMLTIAKQEAFDRHKKLKTLGLLRRVEPRIVQYRQGMVDHKWIKHRNHTYYELTARGKAYSEYNEDRRQS